MMLTVPVLVYLNVFMLGHWGACMILWNVLCFMIMAVYIVILSYYVVLSYSSFGWFFKFYVMRLQHNISVSLVVTVDQFKYFPFYCELV